MSTRPFAFIFIFLFAGHAWAGDLNPLLSSAVKYRDIRVARVISSDRLILENDEKVSLIGIKGPQAPKPKEQKRDEHGFIIHDEDPTTPFEVEAVGFVRSLVGGKPVRLEFDAQRRSDNGDLLAYVIIPDGRILNAEVLRQGYARLKLSPPNMKYAQELRAAYREARHEMRGMSAE